jgi:asparagine synthase (glutamine-hydrolysing)
MCGICGLYSQKAPDEAAVARATGLLRHRGPDGSGVFRDDPLALGHTRLSIIDVEGGAQPLENEDGTVVTVFNGEIWNHKALRAELVRCGHTFRTRADTEVLVHGYEEWGDDLPARLDGMFAFALWDARQRRLMLARDRLGKKPMYISEAAGVLAFGSDARSVTIASNAQPRVNTERIAEYLFQRYVVSPHTLFEGVRRLPPGHALVHDAAGTREWAYWSLRHASGEELEAPELRSLLVEAARKRLMSDVPIGALLSGGVDSAAVVGLAAEAGATDLQTFTIGFDDAHHDERELARATADRYRTNHHELVVDGDAFFAALPRLAWYRDEPIAEPSEVPLLLLAEFAGAHVKVVLTGDGGDELFGGYPKYRAERFARVASALPPAALRTAARLSVGAPSHRRLARAFESVAIRDELLRWASWFRTFSAAELGALLVHPDAVQDGALSRSLARVLAPYADVDPRRKMLIGDLLTYLPDNMLLRSDKVLMAASLEGRMPLLDVGVVERVALLRGTQRASLRTGKKLLREAVRDLVPPEVLAGRKRGFPVPVATFLVGRHGDVLTRLLLSERTLSRGILQPDAVRGLVAADGRTVLERDLKLFTLAALELWFRANVDEVRSAPPAWSDILD